MVLDVLTENREMELNYSQLLTRPTYTRTLNTVSFEFQKHSQHRGTDGQMNGDAAGPRGPPGCQSVADADQR